MLESLLTQPEGKTIEFKENTKSLEGIVKTVIAFANTAGGNIVIGVGDSTKKIVGISNILKEEERISSTIADSIEPLIIPDIRIQSFRNKELLVISVPHMTGPFYLKSAGPEHGVYIRLGSTNRRADNGTILSLKMLSKNISFDELPCVGATIDDIDAPLIQELFAPITNVMNKSKYESLGIMTRDNGKTLVSNGGILLFSKNRFKWFPDSQIRCVCFADESRGEIIDQKDVTTPLAIALDEIIEFIIKNTRIRMVIDKLRREDRPQYPFRAIREALINAIIHADYTLQGVSTQISIFSNRIEITNPGGLVFGQTMEQALSGISSMRNKMMGRIFREIKLIETLGTGIGRIIKEYRNSSTKQPLFEELNTHFRVTLYSPEIKQQNLEDWQKKLVNALSGGKQLSTIEIAALWGVTTRTARTRLGKMIEMNLVHRLGTSTKDPRAVFILV